MRYLFSITYVPMYFCRPVVKNVSFQTETDNRSVQNCHKHKVFNSIIRKMFLQKIVYFVYSLVGLVLMWECLWLYWECEFLLFIENVCFCLYWECVCLCMYWVCVRVCVCICSIECVCVFVLGVCVCVCIST